MGCTKNTVLVVGVVLALLGTAGLVLPQFTTSHPKDIAKIGDVKIQTQEDTPDNIPPFLSGAAVVLGLVLIGGSLYRPT